MTVPNQENPIPEVKNNDKELNFRMLEARYQKQLSEERAARLEAERKAQEMSSKNNQVNEDDEDESEPYIDKKRLDKKLAKFGEQSKTQTQSEIQKAVHTAIQEERKQNWMKQNSDFYDVMNHANKLEQLDPELAESILSMPDGFERQKLVYKNIKALGLHNPEVKKSSIQDKIESNRRSPYYQPSNVGTAPYASHGDFSPVGQKQAYDKMNELKARLRLG
jgi:hypothetical protein